MRLSGSEIEALVNALCAYLTVQDLRDVIRFHLNLDLDEIAFGQNKRDLTFKVVDYLDRRGLVDRLACGAVKTSANPALKSALQPWLGNSSIELQLPAVAWDQVIPPWAMTHQQKVKVVQGLRRGSVDPGLVSDPLRRAYARSLNEDDTNAVLREANRVRSDADPKFTISAVELNDLGVWAYLGARGYWERAFNRACERGGRLLGSVLLAAPPDLYEAHKPEIVAILRELKEPVA